MALTLDCFFLFFLLMLIQFTHVLNCELNDIREACQGIQSDYKPGITAILITKVFELV